MFNYHIGHYILVMGFDAARNISQPQVTKNFSASKPFLLLLIKSITPRARYRNVGSPRTRRRAPHLLGYHVFPESEVAVDLPMARETPLRFRTSVSAWVLPYSSTPKMVNGFNGLES